MYKSSYKLLKQLKLLTCSIQGLDLTDSGWVGVLDGIKLQLGLAWAELGNNGQLKLLSVDSMIGDRMQR